MPQRPSIRALLAVEAAGVLFFTISIPVEVVLAEHTLHASAGGYGATAVGVGRRGGRGQRGLRPLAARCRRGRLIAVGVGALGVGFVVMAAAPALWVAIVGAAIAGLGNGVEAVAGADDAPGAGRGGVDGE